MPCTRYREAGYKTVITMPEKMSAEKVAVLRALGADIIRTPTSAVYDAPESHIGVARRLQRTLPNAHILDQYGNPDNPLAHELGTAEEIWAQTEGRVTCVVAGAGTGGTVTGLARGLRKHQQGIKVVAADPHGSILALPRELNEEHANEGYQVEGIGYDFIPDVLEQKVVDQWYKTDDRTAFRYARQLIAEEGILCGGSSGSAMDAMTRAVVDLGLGADDVVVVVLPDSIRSYLSKASFVPIPRLAVYLTVGSSSTTTGSQPTTSSRTRMLHHACRRRPTHFDQPPSPPCTYSPSQRSRRRHRTHRLSTRCVRRASTSCPCQSRRPRRVAVSSG